MEWKCVERVEGVEDVFTGYGFSGVAYWNDDSINLSYPDNAEMIVEFKVPDNLLCEGDD
mgnify:CR=1 FL=1